MTKQKRKKIIIWLYSFKQFNSLKKYGFIHYSSRDMNYVVMYVDSDRKEDIVSTIEGLSFVREVTVSPFDTVDTTVDQTMSTWLDKIKEDEKKKKQEMG